MVDVIRILVSSFLASLGFGVLFNIHGNKLFLAGIGGSIGGVVYHLSLQYGCSEMMAMFFGSISFSLYSEILARMFKTPVTTFIICALIPLVPGGGMYKTMLEAISGHADKALTLGINTMCIAGVLALGILLVSTITRAIFKTKRQAVNQE